MTEWVIIGYSLWIELWILLQSSCYCVPLGLLLWQLLLYSGTLTRKQCGSSTHLEAWNWLVSADEEALQRGKINLCSHDTYLRSSCVFQSWSNAATAADSRSRYQRATWLTTVELQATDVTRQCSHTSAEQRIQYNKPCSISSTV